jgi:hypothetical protein
MGTTTNSDERLTPRERSIESSVVQLVDDAREVVAATTVLQGTVPANRRRYERQLCRALTDLEIDLGTARASMDAYDAVTSDDLQDTMRGVEQSAQRWLEELSVRTHLGKREISDRVGDLEHRLDRARGEVRRATRRIDDAVESDLDSMRTLALHAISEIRDAVSDSVDAVFHYVA